MGLVTSVLADRLLLAAHGILAAILWTAALYFAASPFRSLAPGPTSIAVLYAASFGWLLELWAAPLELGRAALLPHWPRKLFSPSGWLLIAAALAIFAVIRFVLIRSAQGGTREGSTRTDRPRSLRR